MTDDTNKTLDDQTAAQVDDQDDDDDVHVDNPDTKALLEKMVAQELKPIKEKLNKAYEAKEKAEKVAAQLKEAARKAEIKALEDAGKHEEALKAKIADLEAEMDGLRKTNTELTRNRQVEAALNGIEGKTFRNTRSRDVAFREIVDQLVQKEDGSWVHRTGLSIDDYVRSFTNDEEFEFLFKAVENRGTGAPGRPGSPDTGIDLSKGVRSIKDPTKLMELAAKGKLGRKSY